MLDEIIQSVSDTIEASKLVQRWGGYCQFDGTTKPFPVGISKKTDQKGNTYTYDDNIKTTGFLQLSRINSQRLGNNFYTHSIPLIIHLFTNRKKVAKDKYYSTGLALMSYLQQNTSYQNKSLTFENVEHVENLNCEYVKITLTIRTAIECDITQDNNPEKC